MHEISVNVNAITLWHLAHLWPDPFKPREKLVHKVEKTNKIWRHNCSCQRAQKSKQPISAAHKRSHKDWHWTCAYHKIIIAAKNIFHFHSQHWKERHFSVRRTVHQDWDVSPPIIVSHCCLTRRGDVCIVAWWVFSQIFSRSRINAEF